MELPEHYKNLTIEQKRIIVINLISQFGDQGIQGIKDTLSDEQIEFLFVYFFTESRETRERMWDDMQKKNESILRELEQIAGKLQNLNLEISELLAEREDIESFRNSGK